ncbi:MAG: extracellular solute-binding protein, partial [Bacilli bacterium]
MKKWMRTLAVTATALTLIASSLSTATTKAKSTPELKGELTVYTAIESELIPDYLQSFNKKYPNVKLNIVRDSTGVITSKLLAEGKNTKADVIWGVAASSLLTLDAKGMLAGYTPKGADRIRVEFKDKAKEAKWVGNTAFQTAIVVNTQVLKEKNLPMPTSFKDLTKPVYKGQIVMPNP